MAKVVFNWQRVRRSRRAPKGYMARRVLPYRPGRPPTSIYLSRPPRFTEEPPSRPTIGPVVRRAMSYLQSQASQEPENATKRAAASSIIVDFNTELNHYLTVLLPAYNERVRVWNDAMQAWNRAVRFDRLNGNDVDYGNDMPPRTNPVTLDRTDITLDRTDITLE